MKTLFALSVCLLTAGVALAGPGPGRGHFGGPGPGFGPGHEAGPGHPIAAAFLHGRWERIADHLDLTEAQRDQVRTLGEDLRATVEPLRESMGPLHESLRTALDATTPNATAVGEIVIEIDVARDQIKAATEAFIEDFEALLTPEQLELWEQWRENHGERGRGRGGRGPGRN